MFSDGPNTALARALLTLGVEQALLQRALEQVRGGGPGVNLASLLAGRGLVPAETLARAAQALRDQAPQSQPRQPSRLGAYRLVRELARGGMGSVHEAVHVETGARVALKRILPDLLSGLDDELLERFRREAQLSARVQHPGIVPVHTAELGGPQPYLVQALFTGGSLQDQVERGGPLGPEATRELGICLAEALQVAHAAGVVHRDLKPQNILYDERGQPAITDFGLAAARGQGLTLTQTGEILGSPAYMPPEQVRDARTADARSDVYALGAVLYFALTGQAPHRGQNVFAVLQRVLESDPPPLAELAPHAPLPLRQAIERALAKAPARRPASAAELATALAGAVEAVPRAGIGRALAALGGLAAAVGVGLVLLSRPSAPDPLPSPRPRVEAPPMSAADGDSDEASAWARAAARVVAGEPATTAGDGLDAVERTRLLGLEAALGWDLEPARAAFPESQRVLDLLAQTQALAAGWTDPVQVRWGWDPWALRGSAQRLVDDPLSPALDRAVQRAFARYLMFCPPGHAAAILRRRDDVQALLATARGSAANAVLRCALIRRYHLRAEQLARQDDDVGSASAYAFVRELREGLLERDPPRDLRRLDDTEVFCLALVLTGEPPSDPDWAATMHAVAEQGIASLRPGGNLSRFVDLVDRVRRDLMMDYRERAFQELRDGADGEPWLSQAVDHAAQLGHVSDALEAAITLVLAGDADGASARVADAQRHGILPLAALCVEAEIELLRGNVESAAALVGSRLSPTESGSLSGVDHRELPKQLFALQYQITCEFAGEADPKLLREASDLRRPHVAIPWRTADYTRRMVADPQVWRPRAR